MSMYEMIRDRVGARTGCSGSRVIVDLYAAHWKPISEVVCSKVTHLAVEQGDIREEVLGGGRRLWFINFVMAENWADLVPDEVEEASGIHLKGAIVSIFKMAEVRERLVVCYSINIHRCH